MFVKLIYMANQKRGQVNVGVNALHIWPLVRRRRGNGFARGRMVNNSVGRLVRR